MRSGGRQFTALLVAVLALSGCSFQADRARRFEQLAEEKKLLVDVWTYVNSDYFDSTFNRQDWWSVRQQYLSKPVASRTELYAQINQMLGSLDEPFTRFLSPEQFENLEDQNSGELSGVGLQLNPRQSVPTVLTVYEGSPAFRKGIQPEDVIAVVDGQSTSGLDLDTVAARIRGPLGSRVILGVRRAGRAFDVPLERAQVTINPVSAAIKQGRGGAKLGYIRLTRFNDNAVEQMRRTIRAFEAQKVAGYVLDLRANPGGRLTAGVEIARFWLKPGQTIVYTEDRRGAAETARAQQLPLSTKPLVVLVNSTTASASEVVAAALKDNRRALLVGEKTFGKGLIQGTHRFPDGSGLVVSNARYLTPNRQDIHKKGIEPNLKVPEAKSLKPTELATPLDNQYTAALAQLGRLRTGTSTT